MDRLTHPFTPEEVMAYLDGELSAERASAAAAHLELCSECRAVAAGLRGVSSQLAAWQVETAPDGFSESAVRAAALPRPAGAPRPQEKDTRRVISRSFLMWGTAFAVATALLLAVSIPTLNRSSHLAQEAQRAPRVFTPPALPPPASAPLPVLPVTPSGMRATKRSNPEPSQRLAGVQRDRAESKEPANSLNQAYERQLDVSKDANTAAKAAPASRAAANEPMIIRRASLALLTKEFDSARAAMENLVRAHQGYFGQLDVATPPNAGRALTATVRVPAAQLDPVLVELRKLGHVEQESQSADDVTRQYVDLSARLSNARETEKRLVDILRERTGKVSDVLEVEQQISSVRQQIEQMDAQRKNMDNMVQFASVDLRITEEYKQSLETPAPSLGTRIHNAAVEGFLGAAEMVVGLLLFLLNAGPTLLLLASVLAWPAWRGARWLRRHFRLEAATSQSA